MASKREKTPKRPVKSAKDKKTAMDTLVAFMKRSPKAVYADAQAACLKAGYRVYPIMWGRAQVMLGRVTARPKGSRKVGKRGAGALRALGRPRGPGRPRKTPAAEGVVLPISGPADLVAWQQVVEGLNGGRKVTLQYDGQDWLLAVM